LWNNDENRMSSLLLRSIYIALILWVSGCAERQGGSPESQSYRPEMTEECGDSAFDLVFNPDGKSVATSTSNARVCFWEIPSGRLMREIQLDPEPSEGISPSSDVLGLAYSPDGKFLAAGMEDDTVRLIATTDWHEVRRFTAHGMGVRAVAFSPDGRTIASAGFDSPIRLWEVENGRVQEAIEGNEYKIETISFSGDGRYIITGDSGGIIRVWDLEGGLIERSFDTASKGIVLAEFMGGGNHILAVEMGHKVFLIGRKTGRRVLLYNGKNVIFSGGLSPDAHLLVVGGEGTIYLHNARTGKLIRKLTAGNLPVGAISFSPDGVYFAATGYDGINRLFDSHTGDLVLRFPLK